MRLHPHTEIKANYIKVSSDFFTLSMFCTDTPRKISLMLDQLYRIRSFYTSTLSSAAEPYGKMP